MLSEAFWTPNIASSHFKRLIDAIERERALCVLPGERVSHRWTLRRHLSVKLLNCCGWGRKKIEMDDSVARYVTRFGGCFVTDIVFDLWEAQPCLTNERRFAERQQFACSSTPVLFYIHRDSMVWNPGSPPLSHSFWALTCFNFVVLWSYFIPDRCKVRQVKGR